jgi:hypothetical protein
MPVIRTFAQDATNRTLQSMPPADVTLTNYNVATQGWSSNMYKVFGKSSEYEWWYNATVGPYPWTYVGPERHWVDGVVKAGAMCTLIMPQPYVVSRLFIDSPTSTGWNWSLPTDFALVGGYDGTTWYQIDRWGLGFAWQLGGKPALTRTWFDVRTPKKAAYTRLAIIMYASGGAPYLMISEMGYQGLPLQPAAPARFIVPQGYHAARLKVLTSSWVIDPLGASGALQDHIAVTGPPNMTAHDTATKTV